MLAEGHRSVPVTLRFEHRSYRTAIQGIDRGSRLQRILDHRLRPIALPQDGLVLTDHLGTILGVRVGDRVRVDVLEGNRARLELPIVALVKQYLGVSGYMDRRALNRALDEGDLVSGALVSADRADWQRIYDRLKEMPRVAGVTVHESSIRAFFETMAETVLYFSSVATLLGATIVFGVVYNSARIALAERGRELASLRVLGFRRSEVAYILLGELAVLDAAGHPRRVCRRTRAVRLPREPLRVGPLPRATRRRAVHAGAGCGGGAWPRRVYRRYVVWRRLGALDLVAVLKTRE